MKLGTVVMMPGGRQGKVIRQFPAACCRQSIHLGSQQHSDGKYLGGHIFPLTNAEFPRVLVEDTRTGEVHGYDEEWLEVVNA